MGVFEKQKPSKVRAGNEARSRSLPLQSIAIPQQIVPTMSDHEYISSIIAPILDTKVDSRFETVQVCITMYGITGIVGQTIENRKRRSILKRGSRKAGVLPEKGRYDFGDHPDAFGVPITAVASCKQNISKSSTPLETFLPSLPIMRISSGGTSGCVRYKANWMTNEGTPRSRDPEEADPFTFKIIRKLKRESFRRNVKIQDVSNYVSEIVDLKLSLGRGKELFSLGIASLVVTGEEEGEVIMNIPVKPLQSQTPILNGGKAVKPKVTNIVFSHDPKTIYSIDDNATLRIGLRISPYDESHSQSDSCGSFQNEKIILEVDRENSLLAHLFEDERPKPNDFYHIMKGQQERGCVDILPQQLEKEIQGCHPIQICSDVIRFFDIDTDETILDEGRSVPGHEKGLVLPTSLLSSFSESVDSHFTSQRTEL